MKTKSLLILGALISGHSEAGWAQANVNLSNLMANTAVNQHLLPNANNARDLGSAALAWRYLYLGGRLYLGGILALHASGTDNFFGGPYAGNTTLTGSGWFALSDLTTGDYNTAAGYAALSSNTSGLYNTANGSFSLYNNTSGQHNTATGYSSLYNNTTGDFNTAYGYRTLNDNTTGFSNTAIGHEALGSNTTGAQNTALGLAALRDNTTGNYNTSAGMASLESNTSGAYNTAYGWGALSANATASNNTACGYGALYFSTGSSNSAFGFQALYNNSTGFFNVAGGYEALEDNTTGDRNTAIGYQALDFNTTGNNNTALGYGADASANNLSNATAIGYTASVTASNRVRIGNAAVTSIGGQVGWTNFSDGRYKRAIKEDVPGLDFINSLRPVTYTVDVRGLEAYYHKDQKKPVEQQEADVLMDHAMDDAAKIVHTGFIAQEVEAAADKVHFDFSGVDKPAGPDDLYGLRYDNFIAPLVKAVQELSKQNEALQQQINTLKAAMTDKGQPAATAVSGPAATSALLYQNVPNPFAVSTTIRYSLPEQHTTAWIAITDLNGRLMLQMPVRGSGSGSVQVDAGTLAAGTYTYSLVSDGRQAASRQMVLVR